VSLVPRAGHALRTCGINLGVTVATRPVMDEATQVRVMFLYKDKDKLLDSQSVIMLRGVMRKGRTQPICCRVHQWLTLERRLLYCHYDRLMSEKHLPSIS